MAGALRDRHGGILGLLALLDKHQEAVEYDLIERGYFLRDLGSTFTWHDLGIIIKHLPRTSALVRVIEGDDHPWGLTEQLLAAALDALHAANWQRGEGKKRDKPKPIPRPGVAAEKKYGSGAIPMDEMADWLGWELQLAEPEPVASGNNTGRRRDARGRFMKN